MTDISIVIPVYNCEKYIKQCIESVQQQTLKNLEIICIDDGSIDSSPNILEELAVSDQRIRIFRQQNKGAGAARNSGIEKARGTYIAFLDADDYYMDPEALHCLVQRCIQLDIKACGGVMCHNIDGIERRASDYGQLVQYAGKGVLRFSEYPLDYDFTTFVFERAVIWDNQIRFPEYSFYEDPPFLVKTLFYAQEYAVADIEFYCYRIRPDQKKFTGQNCLDLLWGLKENLEFSIDNHIRELFAKTLSRLEYEYGGRILAGIWTDRLDGLQALIEVNNVVRKQPGYEGYMVRPLKMIFGQITFMQDNYEKKLLNSIKGYERFYIFGTGMTTRKFWDYLKGVGACEKVEGFLVTDKRKMQGSLENVPVYEVREFKECLSQRHIYVAVKGFFVAEIVQALDEAGIKDYEILIPEMLGAD